MGHQRRTLITATILAYLEDGVAALRRDCGITTITCGPVKRAICCFDQPAKRIRSVPQVCRAEGPNDAVTRAILIQSKQRSVIICPPWDNERNDPSVC